METLKAVSNNIRKRLEDPLKMFKVYERIIAVVCICLPAVLRLYEKDTWYPQRVQVLKLDEINNSAYAAARDSIRLIPKDHLGFRTTISDYVYSSNSFLFGMLLCIAAMLFVFNGAVYFKSQRSLRLSKKGKWYNIVLGISLLGVICTPHRDWVYLHYTLQ